MVRRLTVLALAAALTGGAAWAQQVFEPPSAPQPPAPPPVAAPPPAPIPGEKPFVPETPAPVPAEKVPEKKVAPAKPPEPAKRGRATTAILQALDKVTAETLRFEAPVGKPVRYKSLVFTVRACETAAPDEMAPEAAAYVIIDSQPKAQPGRSAPPARQVFRGWMFASSPGLNPMQHPVYDAWLIACKTAD